MFIDNNALKLFKSSHIAYTLQEIKINEHNEIGINFIDINSVARELFGISDDRLAIEEDFVELTYLSNIISDLYKNFKISEQQEIREIYFKEINKLLRIELILMDKDITGCIYYDMTDKMILEKDIFNHKKNLNNIMNMSRFAFILLEKKEDTFVYRYVNDSHERIFKKDRSEFIGKQIKDHYNNISGNILEKKADESYKKQCMVTFFLEMRPEIGSSVSIKGNFIPFYEDGRNIGVLGIFIDFSIFQKAQHELEIAFKNIGFDIWRLDCIQMMFTKNHTLSLKEDIEVSFYNYIYKNVHPKDANRVIENTLSFINGKNKIYYEEYRVLDDNGDLRWIRSIGYAVKYNCFNKLQEVLGINIDITEHKKIINEMTMSKNELVQALDRKSNLIIAIDNNSNIRYIKEDYSDIYKELVGKNVIQYVYYEDREKIKDLIEAIGMGKESDVITFRYVDEEDGLLKWIECYVRPDKDQNNKIVGIIATGKDITKRQLLLEEVLDFDNINMEYQPILDISNNKVKAIETVCKWKHPIYGDLMLEDFWEETKFSEDILKLQLQVFKHIISRIKRWEWIKNDNIRINFNLTAVEVNNANFISKLVNILKENDYCGDFISIEISYISIIKNLDVFNDNIRRLKEVGCTIIIKNIGVDFKSFLFMELLEFDVLKVSWDMIKRIDESRLTKRMFRMVYDSCMDYQKECIIDKVHTKRNKNILRNMGFAYMQGESIHESLNEFELVNQYSH